MLKFIKPYGDCSSVGRAIGCGPIGRRFESDQSPDKFSGRSVVRLAHLVWDEGVAGSNPAIPTLLILEELVIDKKRQFRLPFFTFITLHCTANDTKKSY